MKILVTGGKGFIGTHLVEALEKLGETVIVSDPVIGRPIQEFNDYELRDIDIIFHLGAISRIGVSYEQPAKVMENNFSSTLRVAEHCRKNSNTKLIFASSSSVKFADLTRNPYALSKKIGEDLLTMYCNSFGIKASSVRFFNVYGPGEADYGSNTTLVKACSKAILSGKNPQVNGDGSAIRDYTHVADVVSGLLKIYKETELKPLYELGFGEATVSVKEVVEEFIKGTNLNINWKPARKGDFPVNCSDISLRPEGWVPTIKILDYIKLWKEQNL
jgi:UDP-glucose 4-epimerase